MTEPQSNVENKMPDFEYVDIYAIAADFPTTFELSPLLHICIMAA